MSMDYENGYQEPQMNETAPAPKKQSFVKKLGTTIALALVFGLVAGGTIRLINPPVKVQQPSIEDVLENQGEKLPEIPEITEKPDAGPIGLPAADGTMSIKEVAKKVLPSTVAINCKIETTYKTFFGQTYTEEKASAGTGIIVGKNDTELLIATNNHVVNNATQISAVFIDDENAGALIKGTDADNDLAIIAVPLAEIADETMEKISIAELGDSGVLEVGEPVVAVGNALGYGQSVTSGIVSALNRTVTIENITSILIQTDAAINPGNSGGALVNMKGEVIGINSAKFASASVEGMGYAIPIDTAKPILDGLMNRVTRVLLEDHGYLGVAGQDIPESMANTYHFPVGILVTELQEGAAAQKAGIMKGDVITKFDGQSVAAMAELSGLMKYYAIGETVEMTVMRQENGEYVEKQITATLCSRAEAGGEAPADPAGEQNGESQDGQNDVPGDQPGESRPANPFEDFFGGNDEGGSGFPDLFKDFFGK